MNTHQNRTILSLSIGFGLTASNFWTLIRIFPLLFGELLKNNIYYKHFLSLVEIFFLLCDTTFNEEKICLIESKIFDYLTSFKQLYPGQPIRAKFHFMIHYGRAIRLFGPISHCGTLRFESKHSTFKQMDRSIHNHINLEKSLTEKHQNLQVYHLTSKNYFGSNQIGTYQRVDLDNEQCIKTLIGYDKLKFYKWLIYENMEYHLDDIICYENSITPLFGKIKHLILVENKRLCFFLEKYKNEKYIDHLRAYYLIEDNNSLNPIIYFDDLKNKYPNSIYRVAITNICSNFNNYLEVVSIKYPIN
jgi:hypothetical protein